MTSSRPPDARNPVSEQLLVQLVHDTLDPGYEAAAARRPAGLRRWYDRPAVAVGCLLIGFVLVVAYVHTNRGAPQAQRVHDDLVSRVHSAQGAADDLSTQLRGLDSQLTREQSRALPQDSTAARTRAQLLAGQTAVHGPGIVVTLTDPPQNTASAAAGGGGVTPIGTTHVLTDRDVRSVVNELWGDGAEAVSVNGVRLSATSAIRFAGQAVLVDFQPLTSPYTISAIGNANELSTAFADSAAASRYKTLSGAEGVGFVFGEQTALSLPAAGPFTPQYATAAPTSARRPR